MARTAVVAGTATAVSNRVSRRQAQRWGAQDAGGYGQQEYAEPAYAEPPAPSGPDPIEQLKQLAELHSQGVLTDQEFAAQKARLLG
jgi:hypothetical protein